jgi:hypothetical protein
MRMILMPASTQLWSGPACSEDGPMVAVIFVMLKDEVAGCIHGDRAAMERACDAKGTVNLLSLESMLVYW